MACNIRERDWRRELWRSLAAEWPLKAGGITSFIALFFVAYLYLLWHPAFTVQVIPLTAFDRWIGFHPTTLILYGSLWIYVSLPPSVLTTRRELITYGWGATALSLIGLTIFFFWPTTVAQPGMDWAQSASWEWLRKIDAAGNACPSLHAGFAVFTALWLDRLLRNWGSIGALRVANACWGVGIVVSTLTTKQHVVIDAVAGIALGAIVGLLHRRRAAPWPSPDGGND